MNYISVSSAAVHRQRVEFPGPTYIDYYTENNAAMLLKAELLAAQLKEVLMAESSGPILYPQRPLQKAKGNFEQNLSSAPYSPHGFSHNYTVNMPPLAVLEFLKQHGYKVVGTNTIGSIRDTCIWTLHKQDETTDQSTPQMASRMQPLC